MKKVLLANIAAAAFALATPALAADLPTKAAPLAERFNWTGCHLGVHLGGATGSNDLTDPAQLVQDSFLGAGSTAAAGLGVTTASPTQSGAVIGGQIGCDYQFDSHLVLGIEGSASGTTLSGSTTVALPLGNPDVATVKINTDFLASLTARGGFAFDDFLIYGRGGLALAGSKYDITGSFVGAPFWFEGLNNRYGWTAGAGVDWAFARNWSARLEYDYYQFGHNNVLMSDSINGFSGLVDVRQSIQVVKLGLDFHVNAAGW